MESSSEIDSLELKPIIVEAWNATSLNLLPEISNTESDSENESVDLKPNIAEASNLLPEIKMESDSDNESLDLKPNIEEAAKVTSLNLLPEISKKKYETAYKLFMDWRQENNKTSCSENVLLAYFGEISSKFKSSTLWTQYSMLRTTLSINNDVDIAKYSKLRAFLKRQSDGYRPKKSKTFTSNDINKFIKEAPDSEYLLTKVALIMGVIGACRRHELHQMKTTNFNDLGSAVLVTIPTTKTKVRKFTITGHFYEIFKKYADLRPANVNDSYFFLNYQKGKCTVQKVGINKFGAMGKQIAKYLKLPNPESYTGHCFRRSSTTVVVHTTEEVNVPSTSTTQVFENQDNLTFQHNSTNIPKMIFNNCSNITFNIVNNK